MMMEHFRNTHVQVRMAPKSLQLTKVYDLEGLSLSSHPTCSLALPQFGVGADRVSVAKQMLQCGQAPGDIISGTTAHSAAPQVAILDDGLQYLSLHRDLEVDPLSISDSTAQAVISTAQA
eukprot:2797624-Pyramimonas_sp.AAC.1